MFSIPKKMLYGLKREKCRKNKTNELFNFILSFSTMHCWFDFFYFFPESVNLSKIDFALETY